MPDAADLPVTIRPMRDADAPRLAALFAANLRDAVADPAASGFVQGAIDAETLRGFSVHPGGVLVAAVDGRPAGFVCACPVGGDGGPPPIREIRRRLRSGLLSFAGGTLSEPRTFFYGPVVIAPEHRGRGLLRPLFEAVRRAWSDRADTGLAFVEDLNTRSLNAHVHGLGMTEIDHFTLADGRGYATLAFRTAEG